MLPITEINWIFAGINAVLRFGFGIQNLVTEKVVQENIVLPRPKKETNWLVVEDYFQNQGKNLVQPNGPYYQAWQDKDIPETAEAGIETLVEAYEGIVGAKSIIEVFKNSSEFQEIFAHVDEQEQYAVLANLFKVEEKKKNSLFAEIFNMTLGVVKENAPLFAQNNALLSQAIRAFLETFPTDITALTKEDIFRGLLDVTLKVASDNANLFLGDNKFGSVLKAILSHASDNITTTTQGNYLKELLQAAIDGVSQTTGLLINNVVLQDTINSILEVASTNLQQDGLFRTQTLTEILRITLDSISRNAQLITGGENIASMVLSSILDVANQDPSKLLNPNKALFLDILKISLETIGKNADLFLKEKNIVSQVLTSVLQAIGQNPGAAVSGELFKELFLTSLIEALRNLQLVLAGQPASTFPEEDRRRELTSPDSSLNTLTQTLNALLKATSGAIAQFLSEDQKTQISQSAIMVISRNLAIFKRYDNLFFEVLITTLEAIYRDPNRLAAGALLIDTVKLALTTAAKNPRLYDQEKWLLPNILDSVLQTAAEEESGLIRGDLLMDFLGVALKSVSLHPKPFIEDSQLLSRALKGITQSFSEQTDGWMTGENLIKVSESILMAVSKEPDLVDQEEVFKARLSHSKEA